MIRTIQFWLKMVLVGVWFFILTLVFYLLSFPFFGAKWLSWAYARFLAWGSHPLLGVRVKVIGRENIVDGGAIYIINHQSNFDPFLMGTMFPKHTVIIGKKNLLKIPLFGQLFKATNNIVIDRTDRNDAIAGLNKATEALNESHANIWIFPEGTRSKGKGLGRFKKGPFHMAIAAQAPLVPVVAKPMGDVLDMQKKIARGGRHEIRILPAIETKGLDKDAVPELLQKAEQLFAETLSDMTGQPADEIFSQT